MKKVLIGTSLCLGLVGIAYACTTQTVMTPNGAQTCTTCCQNNNCTTTCI